MILRTIDGGAAMVMFVVTDGMFVLGEKEESKFVITHS